MLGILVVLLLADVSGFGDPPEKEQGEKRVIDYSKILVVQWATVQYYHMETGKRLEDLPVLLEPPVSRPAFREGLCPTRRKPKGKIGYVDKIGNFVIEPRFDFADRVFRGYRSPDGVVLAPRNRLDPRPETHRARRIGER